MDRLLYIPHWPDFVYSRTAKGIEFHALCKYVHKFSEEILKNRRKALEEKIQPEKKYSDFIDLLLVARDENGVGLTNQEIRSEIDAFLFAGHETTAVSLAFLLYNLAKHPEYQKKIRNELKIFSVNGKTQLDWGSLLSLTFMTKCIKESLRLFPPLPLLLKELSEDRKLRQYHLRKGQLVHINVYGLHHSRAFWKDPQVYNPDRWNETDGRAFMPFGFGPRTCIGQQFSLNEIKLTVARVLNRYDLKIAEGFELKKTISLLLMPLGGVKLLLKPIE
eukprot:m.108956 g.108956  ORF g.108956 m.108956 type:complete len:276 (+) comp37332_c0_seq1:797-1624(+)